MARLNIFSKFAGLAVLAGSIFNGTPALAADHAGGFDAYLYAIENGDVSDAVGWSFWSLFDHYMNYGRHEGRRGNGQMQGGVQLDPFLWATRPEINAACGGASYVQPGGYYPMGNLACIVQKSIDCLNGTCPGGINHTYVNWQRRLEIRNSHGSMVEFSANAYLQVNPDVASFCQGFYGGNIWLRKVCAKRHFIEYGMHTGRSQQ